MLRSFRFSLLFGLGLAQAAAGAEPVDFNRDIRPILSENCFFCHGPDANTRQAELRLDTHEGAKAVLEAGDSAVSELYRRVSSTDDAEVMPPVDANRKLSARQIDLLKRWIDEGAEWGEHWAFTPIARPTVPTVKPHPHAVIRNPIDALVQSRLAAEGLEPSPEAARETLIRRVTLDLTGLPPTPQEVDEFLSDNAPNAYERVVDRLLKSSAYGERMAWSWLDAARYADSNGYQGDRERTMWPWRDWVVRAFNDNLPYDQFTVWQLAGDLLPDATIEQRLATGFQRNHMINGEGGRIPEENRVEYVMDMAETAGTVWLGLTFNCCRCHDHKFDPLAQRDYYAMFAFFNQTPVDGGGGDPQTPPVLAVPSPEQEVRIAALAERLKAIDAQIKQRTDELAPAQTAWEQQKLTELTGQDQKLEGDAAGLLEALQSPIDQRTAEQTQKLAEAHRASDDQYLRLRTQQDQAQKELKEARGAVPKVMVMQDMAEPRKSFLLDRGLYNKPGAEVTAAVPGRLPPLPDGAPANRLSLARWLVASENPLTARVTVNRFWQQFFGIGLVKTAEDFGAQGEIPSHPELLDWLAEEFRGEKSEVRGQRPEIRSQKSEVRGQRSDIQNLQSWDVKGLVRLIVTSHTYRQSSRATPAAYEADPENRRLARGPRSRLPSWIIRDQALAAAGLLVPRAGGSPVNGYQPPGVWEEATFGNKKYVQDHGDALYRRSLYTFWRRIIGPTLFFDTASRQTCTVKQSRTNTPLHALTTLNDVTFLEAARALAQRALLDGGDQSAERLDFAFRRVVARPASERERGILLAGLERTRTQFAADPAAAQKLLSMGKAERNEQLDPVEHASWTALCLAILNLDEALTKE